MPDAGGNFKGISLTGKAGEAWERIFGRRDELDYMVVPPAIKAKVDEYERKKRP